MRGEKLGANLPLFWNNDGKDRPKGQICPLAKKEVWWGSSAGKNSEIYVALRSFWYNKKSLGDLPPWDGREISPERKKSIDLETVVLRCPDKYSPHLDGCEFLHNGMLSCAPF
jgi:hypothetical protein